MKTYCDTSLLFSLYAPDANSLRVDAWRKNNPQPLPFTKFHRVELRNALSLAVFQQRLTTQQIQAVWQNLEADLASGLLLSRGGLWHRVFSEAESIATNNSPSLGTRTLDVIHVAAAKILAVNEFCTCDLRQSNLAAEVGLMCTIP